MKFVCRDVTALWRFWMHEEKYICLCCGELWGIYGVNKAAVCRNVPPYGFIKLPTVRRCVLTRSWWLSNYCGWNASDCKVLVVKSSSSLGGATARGGPWPSLQYASRSLGPFLCLSIRLYPSFSGPWTRHPGISFLVFLFVLLHTAFRTASFLGLLCLAFLLYALVVKYFTHTFPFFSSDISVNLKKFKQTTSASFHVLCKSLLTSMTR